MTALIHDLMYDARDLALLAVVLLASLPGGAWIGYWCGRRPAALDKVIDRHTEHLRRIDRLLLIDTLTGLRNQRALEDHALPAAVRNVRDKGGALIVTWLDFDDFKALNARLGQRKADQVVCQAADRMRRSLAPYRATDEIFRRNTGGDEFIILLPGANMEKAGEILRNVLAALHSMGVSATIGAVIAHPGNLPSSPKALLDQAEQQMYRAKFAGKGRISIAQAEPEEAVHDRPVLAIGQPTPSASPTALARP